MATNTANSFAALLGAGGEAAINAGASKKKKKSKAKKQAAGDATAEPAVPVAPEPPAPVEQPVVSKKQQKAAQKEAKQAQAQHDAFQDRDMTVTEAVKHVEKAARETGPGDLVRLWRAWARQLEDVKGGKGLKYVGPDGEYLNFKQVLLKSTALEISAEAALSLSGSPGGKDLAQLLLLCFPPSVDFVPETLAEVILRLGQLISPSDKNLMKAAKKAVYNTVGTLKINDNDSGVSAEDLWLPRLSALDSALDDQEARLQTLSQRAATPNVLKEQVSITTEMVRLSEEKLEMLRTGGTSSARAGAAVNDSVSGAIGQLRDLLHGMVKSTKGSNSKGGKGSQALQNKRSQLREEIQAAEAHLQELRSELALLDSQLGKGDEGFTTVGANYEQHLIAVDALDALLQRSREANLGGEADADAATRATESGAPSAFLSNLERSLQALEAMQTDLSNTLKMTMEKVTRNKRQAQQLQGMDGASAAVANNRKLKADLQRIMDGVANDAETVMNSMRRMLECLEKNTASLKKLPGHSSRIPFYRNIDALVAQIRSGNEEIVSTLSGSNAPEPPLRQPLHIESGANDYDRVKQLEDMLKAARAQVEAKTTAIADTYHGNGTAPSGGRRPSVPTEVPPLVHMPVMAAPPPLMATPAAHPQAPTAMDPVVVPALPASNPVSAAPAPIQPKATPRGWGKVDSSPAVVDESLPSLADAMAASKGKKGKH